MEPSFDSHHIDLPSIVSKPQVNLRKSKTGVQIFLDCKVESQDNIGSSDGESTLPELPAIQVAPKSLNSRVKDDKHHSSPHHKHQIEVKTKDNDEGGLPQIDSHERNLPPIENKTDRSNGKKRKPLYMRMIAEAAKALHHQLEKKNKAFQDIKKSRAEYNPRNEDIQKHMAHHDKMMRDKRVAGKDALIRKLRDHEENVPLHRRKSVRLHPLVGKDANGFNKSPSKSPGKSPSKSPSKSPGKNKSPGSNFKSPLRPSQSNPSVGSKHGNQKNPMQSSSSNNLPIRSKHAKSTEKLPMPNKGIYSKGASTKKLDCELSNSEVIDKNIDMGEDYRTMTSPVLNLDSDSILSYCDTDWIGRMTEENEVEKRILLEIGS